MSILFSEFRFRSRLHFVALLCVFMLIGPPVNASVLPVDQCADSGETASSPNFIGGAPGSMSFTALSVENTVVKRPSGSSANLGQVDPSTGAYVYSNEDISAGTGSFPARLFVERTFNTRMIRNTEREIFRAGGKILYPFGRGSTHNLDGRFQESEIYFGSKRYATITIMLGFRTLGFQKCVDGQFKSMRADGHRLFTDATYSSPGYRFEDRDGNTLYFQRFSLPSGDKRYCNGGYRSCGILRRWLAPNGDWADFNWQEYYSHPTNASYPASAAGPNRMTGVGARVECYITLKGINECKNTNHPWFLVNLNSSPVTVSYAVTDHRLVEVISSRGYKASFTYLDPTVSAGGYCPTSNGNFLVCTPPKNTQLQRNRISNISMYYKSGVAYVKQSESSYGYSWNGGATGEYLRSFTAADGSVTRFDPIFAIYPPGASGPAVTVSFIDATADSYFYHNDEYYNSWDGERKYSYYPLATKQTYADGAIVNYAATFAGRWMPDAYGKWAWQEFVRRMIVSDTAGSATSDYVDAQGDDFAEPVALADALGRTTSNQYSSLGALISRTFPAGNSVSLTYDARGNLISRMQNSKPGSGLPAIQETFAYVGGAGLSANLCINQKTCNKLLSTTDPRGGVTDFTWHEPSGELAASTGPPPSSGADRPMKSLTYGAQADGSGGQVYLLDTSTTKVSSTESVTTTFSYETDVRHFPKMIEVSAGGQTRRGCLKYDVLGRKISETSPNSNLTVCP